MNQEEKVKLGILIPALNEQTSLEDVTLGLINICKKSQISYKILIINDGSTDNTGAIAEKLSKNDSYIDVIHHKKPQNIGTCYKKALERIKSDYITWWPSDGEIPTQLLEKVIPLLNGEDIIIPYPAKDSFKRSITRRILSFIYKKFYQTVFSLKLNYFNANAFIPKEALKEYNLISSGFSVNAELIIYLLRKKKLNFKEIPFDLQERVAGSANAISVHRLFNVLYSTLRIMINSRSFTNE